MGRDLSWQPILQPKTRFCGIQCLPLMLHGASREPIGSLSLSLIYKYIILNIKFKNWCVACHWACQCFFGGGWGWGGGILDLSANMYMCGERPFLVTSGQCATAKLSVCTMGSDLVFRGPTHFRGEALPNKCVVLIFHCSSRCMLIHGSVLFEWVTLVCFESSVQLC